MDSFISWVHFGDLHIQKDSAENYLDFLDLIAEVNEHLAADLDFAFLPGDDADDGVEAQYQLVKKAIGRLRLPVHSITGDHDRKTGTLECFRSYLDPELYRAITIRGFRLLFLNALDGKTAKAFDFSSQQMAWIGDELERARARRLQPIVFTHLYPSELVTQGKAFSELIRNFEVPLVEMGHTHYNELANDGTTIYATTCSTGQIEEGPPGFSITVIDDDVVSWKFKERGPWPFVMITSPADEKLITKPESSTHLVTGVVAIRARVFGGSDLNSVVCVINDDPPQEMKFAGNCWEFIWNSAGVPDGRHSILVRAGNSASDGIAILVNQAGEYNPPRRWGTDFENAIGAYEVKGILGTELGPNEKGTKGPWPSWRTK